MKALAVSVVAAMIAAASLQPAAAADSTAPIKFGIDVPVTGSFADSIKPIQQSDELWEKQVNARGGLLGRRVQLDFVDNKSSPETGISIYQRFLQANEDFIFEDGGSALVQRESTLAEQHHMLMLAPAGFARALYQRGYKFTFFTGNSLSDDVAIGLQHMIESLPAAQRPKSIGYVTLENIAFTAVTKGAQEDFKAPDFTTLLDVTYPPSLNDATPLVENLKQKAPDLVFQSGMSNDTVLFVRAAKQQGLKDKLTAIAWTAAALPNFLSTVGDAADGMIYVTGWDPGVRNAQNGTFVADYRKAYGVDPTYNAAHGFARWEILEQAITATKSLDQAVLRDYIAGHSFDTVVGPMKYNEFGYSVPKDTIVIQFQNGKGVIVWPKEQATGQLILGATQ
jgi:branched-chain amino acid transport system substrate-binding protein